MRGKTPDYIHSACSAILYYWMAVVFGGSVLCCEGENLKVEGKKKQNTYEATSINRKPFLVEAALHFFFQIFLVCLKNIEWVNWKEFDQASWADSNWWCGQSDRKWWLRLAEKNRVSAKYRDHRPPPLLDDRGGVSLLMKITATSWQTHVSIWSKGWNTQGVLTISYYYGM